MASNPFQKEDSLIVSVLGPMGVGKSSIGKIVSDVSRTGCFGTDEKTSQLVGLDLRTTFFRLGEKQFRKWEVELSNSFQLTILTNTGGGTMLLSQNRMRTLRSLSLGLESTSDSIKTRLKVSNNRPAVLLGQSWNKRASCCKVCSKYHPRQTKMKLPDSLNFFMGLLANVLSCLRSPNCPRRGN